MFYNEKCYDCKNYKPIDDNSGKCVFAPPQVVVIQVPNSEVSTESPAFQLISTYPTVTKDNDACVMFNGLTDCARKWERQDGKLVCVETFYFEPSHEIEPL